MNFSISTVLLVLRKWKKYSWRFDGLEKLLRLAKIFEVLKFEPSLHHYSAVFSIRALTILWILLFIYVDVTWSFLCKMSELANAFLDGKFDTSFLFLNFYFLQIVKWTMLYRLFVVCRRFLPMTSPPVRRNTASGPVQKCTSRERENGLTLTLTLNIGHRGRKLLSGWATARPLFGLYGPPPYTWPAHYLGHGALCVGLLK